ncbi:hypothetical protein TREMEDRAFT_73606 [Tremella mesenterica DSM 1558]|uniref:uncharacterized protein n=1 Tax=Tremella mesenterica (strain ATCC 24925 / CBS 8224 / DSM 1558 / NBRC 9311 / NRRL Y-6157 / RJB 2259-6 / UBC 559-6) TaxID=578456 RepID=UPI0003F4A5E2|nr:uncharacterized protein TREMEDRAFT_73606 [Tremella mesenterica DSM 1558]EIW70937.1 hypothetical protein TREMEDRAFT_73606 [Tremella mesenterica DSM 1558]
MDLGRPIDVHPDTDTMSSHSETHVSQGGSKPLPTLPLVHPSTDLNPNAVPSATIDPDKPSSESSPTALPTNPNTNPTEQAKAMKEEHPAVVNREIEKTKAAEREVKGERPLGTMVRGLEDDRLWAMLRAFDRDITHVLHPATHLPPSEPDLRVSTLPNLPSHSETIKRNAERVFAAIGPSSVRGAREVQRLMSWSPEERWRTGSYCAAYFTCWIFGYTMAGVLSFFVAIVCFPSCRRWFFPPVPPAPFTPISATDPTNKKGDESLLGNVDKKTVHRSKAEQAEEQAFEATSILQAYTTRLIFDGSKKGKNAGNSNVGEKVHHSDLESTSEEDDSVVVNQGEVGQDKPQGEESADLVVAGQKIDIDSKAAGKNLSEKEKKKLAAKEAKKKRDELVGKMTKSTEVGLGALADYIERLTNALSPPAPYPDSYARFKIAGAFLVPPMFLLTYVPPWIFARSATFMFGVGMWGQPVLIWAAKKGMELIPDWDKFMEMMDIRNSILSGVPTDAQLTLHLLRVGEALGTPLPRPPPPPLKGSPKEAIKDTAPTDITADDEAEVEAAEEEGGAKEVAVKAKTKTKSHFLSLFRGAGRKAAGFRGDVAVNGKRKTIGSTIDKLFFSGFAKDNEHMHSFPAKLDGTSGHIIIENKNDILQVPQISFVPLSGKGPSFVWSIDDIVEIKKAHVTMSRMALGWASGAEVEGLGLTIRFKSAPDQLAEHAGMDQVEGETKHFTRVGRREQLFVRLVSMGRQRWEVL